VYTICTLTLHFFLRFDFYNFFRDKRMPTNCTRKLPSLMRFNRIGFKPSHNRHFPAPFASRIVWTSLHGCKYVSGLIYNVVFCLSDMLTKFTTGNKIFGRYTVYLIVTKGSGQPSPPVISVHFGDLN